MKRRVYRSKISPAYLGIVALCFPGVYATLAYAWQTRDTLDIAVGTVVAALFLLFGPGMLNTRYWIERSTLHIRCSVLRWRIPVESIIRITAADSMGKGPALSFDTVEVWHHRGRVSISPKHRRDFIADLNRTRETLGVDPIRGIRA